MQNAIVDLFKDTFGLAPASVERVAADGSARTYFRLSGGPYGTIIGGYGPDPDENRAFLSFTRTFREIGLPVPELYAQGADGGTWLVEDLGDTTLFAALAAARAAGEDGFPPRVLAVYDEVVAILPRFQLEGGRAIDFRVAYPRAAFDEQSIRWDLNYFKYHFLKLARIPFNEQRLEDDFERLTGFLLQAESRHFLYRDFQSRNILVQEGHPRFIDYQGGRRGALQYDIASLLYDAKAALPEPIRDRLLTRYLDVLSEGAVVDRDRFLELYRGFVLARILQAMGSYGYRGFFERKPRFLESVPFAAANLRLLMEHGLPVSLPELEDALTRIADAWSDGAPGAGAGRGLHAHVSSFSYRQGYPSDDHGHGGGFVFDCRSLPNPGREEEYEHATGHDADVVAFLEAADGVTEFWEGVWSLVSAHIASFRRRELEDLSVAFGCTGGRHRSVYFAERLARAIRTRFPDVAVDVRHRERHTWGGVPWTP
jgi:aminoglycoside/choline kinase family phosphotransferase